jgi:hypothetical protein
MPYERLCTMPVSKLRHELTAHGKTPFWSNDELLRAAELSRLRNDNYRANLIMQVAVKSGPGGGGQSAGM